MPGRSARVWIVGIALLLGGAGPAMAGPLRQALERELAVLRDARELLSARTTLEREQESLAWAGTVLEHRGQESLRRLDAYRVSRDTRGRQVKARARAMYKLARGGVLRMYFEDVAADRAGPDDQTTAERVSRGRTIRWLVRHDLRELEVHARAEGRARDELLSATRELAAVSSLHMVHELQRRALDRACEAIDPGLHEARHARSQARRGHVPDRSERALLADIVRGRAQLERDRELGSLEPTALRRPVIGGVVGRFGPYEDPLLRLPMIRNGVEFHARRRERVRAAAPGTVALVGSLPGFDDVVVLDHGQGFVSLTARLQGIVVVEGQQIERGAVLGRVAPKSVDDGLGPSIYFELRHGERPIDPTPYLSGAPGEKAQVDPATDDAAG